MVLVNGSNGIGTGWSSSVPNYDPRAIITNIRHLIAGEEQEKLVPYYYGFTGEIIEETGKKEGSYIVKGKIERSSDTTLLISELPVKKWTQDYKQFLEGMMESKQGDPDIKDFQENHTDTTVSFTINSTKEKIDAFEKEKNGLYGKFKLTTSLATTNMTLFDTEGRLVKYKSPEHILSAFYDVRLDYYEKRKELLLRKLRREQKMLSNKARFVEEVCSGELVVSNRKRADILATLQERGYEILEKEDEETTDGNDDSDAEEEDTATDAELARGYEYLLGMKIWSLTYEKAEALREQLAEKTQAVADLEETAPSKLWLDDLDAIEEALDERDAAMDEAEKQQMKAQKKSKQYAAKKKAAAKKSKKRKKGEWDSDSEDSEESDVDMSDSDDEFALPKKKVASTKTRHVAKKKPAPTPKPATSKPAKKAPAVAAKPEPEPSDEASSDDDMGMSLFDRLKKNKAGTSSSLKSSVPTKVTIPLQV
jgi:DNA topoisomerase-2